VGFILSSALGFGEAAFERGDLVPEGGGGLVVFGLQRGFEQVTRLAELGLAVGGGVVRPPAMVFQTGLDAGDAPCITTVKAPLPSSDLSPQFKSIK